MSDTVVLRSAVAGDAACITATIAAAFEGVVARPTALFAGVERWLSREL